MVESYYQSIKKIEDKSFSYLSSKLFQILIEPVLTWVKNKKKLIIIPHEYLYYIPFESLVSSGEKEKNFLKIEYLIKRFSISYHYSANLWYYRNYNSIKNKDKSFIGFAPVFSEKRNKGYILSSEGSRDYNKILRSSSRMVTVDGKRLPQLEASEKELRSIINLFKKYSKKAKGYFYQQASESNFKIADMKNYNYLHIATHSLSDKIYPKLSGLFFSDPDDPISLEDGILYSEETFNLSLDTELIVLSSCESGIGKLVKGEGMIALNRGFFYAGARNIIFSLWKVEDKATSRLMIELYRNILMGKSITDSLRNAKLRLIRDKFTAFPKYWSGFILVGK
jgi:CHAT domain-containing protein